jgi:DedD protein
VKERLTGAIILVALIVLLVPELLTGPIKSAPAVLASQAEEPPLRSYTINLGEDAQASAAAQPAPQPLPAAPPAPSASAAATPPPVPTPAPAPPPEPKAKPAPAPVAKAKSTPAPAPATPVPGSPGGQGFMVQLGSFANRSNAERLAHQLQGQGFSASVSQGSGTKHLYRVRVGPEPDHQAATQLQSKLKAAGHSGSVVPR